MAEATLSIGDRTHIVACREGEQANLEALGAMLDSHWDTARRASGGLSGERTMLFVALILADALDEQRNRPPEAADTALLHRVAARLEAVAAALEEPAPNA